MSIAIAVYLRELVMNPTKCFWTLLIAVCLLADVSAGADSSASTAPAADAYQKGNALLAKRDYDAAIASFTEAMRIDPKDANAYSSRGIAYEGKGDMDKALADYSEAIRIDPKSALAFYNRGIAYARKGDLDKAIADYTEAIGLDPKMAQAYSNRAAAYEKKGAKAEAEEDLAQAEKLGFKRPPARNAPHGGFGNPWLTALLILAAVVCLAVYWIVRKRRLASGGKH